MPPVLRSATRSQSAKHAKALDTTDSGRRVKSQGGRSRNTKRSDAQDPATKREKHDEPNDPSPNPPSEDRAPTFESKEGARAQDPDFDSSQQVSKTSGSKRSAKSLSAEERMELKKAAQTMYEKRWGDVYGTNFDYVEAEKWERSFTIDVLDKLGRGGKKGSSKKGGKNSNGDREERKKKREAVVKKYLKKWDDMLGVRHDYPECDEIYRAFEKWMEGMEETLDELMS